MSLDQFLQYLVSGLSQGSIYAWRARVHLIYAVTRSSTSPRVNSSCWAACCIRAHRIRWHSDGTRSASFHHHRSSDRAIMYVLAIRSAKKASEVSLIIITIVPLS